MSHGETTLGLQATRVYYGATGDRELEKPCSRKFNKLICVKPITEQAFSDQELMTSFVPPIA